MEFKKIIIESSSVSAILSGCTCKCGCNVCNSQDNPKESTDNGGKNTSSQNFNTSRPS